MDSDRPLEGIAADREQAEKARPRGVFGRLGRLSTFDSLHVRDYRLLWLGQIGSTMGQWMDQVTRGWLIYQMTGSAVQLGLATAMRGFPLLIFGVIAGVVADRSGRKRLLVIAQFTNAIINVVLATLVLMHHVHPWHIYVTGFMAGTVQAFQQPARQTLISDIVGNKQLVNALALNSAVLNGSRAIGPAIAGIVIALIGPDGSYYIQAALYLFATVWTLQMRVPDRAAAGAGKPNESMLSSAKEGLVYVSTHRDLRPLMLLALGPVMLGFPYTSLMPIFAQDVLHGGARLQGLLLTCVGIGALGGALTVASMRRKYAYSWPVIVGATAFGVALTAFSQSHWVFLSCGLGFIIGIFSVTYQTQDQTLAQIIAPPRLRGRVMSIWLLNRGLLPVGTLIAGTLAGVFGGPDALLIMAVSSIAVVWTAVLTAPGFIKLKIELSERTAAGGSLPR